jgi:hypothetical protein
MDSKVDLNKITAEISQRKAEKKKVEDALGQTRPSVPSSDIVLNELMQSLQTGQQTNSSKKIKAINEAAKDKVAGQPTVKSSNAGLSEAVNVAGGMNTPPPIQSTPPTNFNNGVDEREEKYLADMHALRTKTEQGLGQMVNEYANVGQTQIHPHYQSNQMTQQPQQPINEQLIAGQVNNFMNEHFGSIVKQAMKDTIIEMYKVEQFKKTLDENKDLIKKIVFDTLKELSNRNKK